jgi:uncharacterized protein (TIGR03067 family)
MLHFGLPLAMLVSTALADEKTNKAPKLDGKWKVTKMEVEGSEIPTSSWGMRDLEFNGDKLRITETHRYITSFDDNHYVDEVEDYKLKLDTKAMQLDYFEDRGFRWECIYKFDKDKLIIALNSNGKRPKDFKVPEPPKSADPNVVVAIDNSFCIVMLERVK